MVLRMAALVRAVLSCNSVFFQDFLSSLTRDKLLNIMETTTDLISTFLLPIAELADIIVKATLGFVLAAKRRRRGKRAGATSLAWGLYSVTVDISFQRAFAEQQIGRTSAAGVDKLELMFYFVLHEDMAE